MKKFFTFIMATMLAVPSFAQFASGGFELDKSNMYYGVRFGVAVGSLSGDTQMNGDIPANNMNYSGMKTGFTLAGIVGLRLSEVSPVFLESGLYYTQRGGKDGKYVAGLNELEIPIAIKYGIKATDEIAVIPFAGPYFSFGVGGKREFKSGTKGVEDEEGVYENFLNRRDLGFKLGCGAEYNMLYLEVAYQIGLIDIADSKDMTTHANQLSINFGVNF